MGIMGCRLLPERGVVVVKVDSVARNTAARLLHITLSPLKAFLCYSPTVDQVPPFALQ